MSYLPITREEMHKRGWDQADFVLITGEAYVDHPSFGHAIISRVLENRGYRVAILAQPDWRSDKDFKRFGKPKLGFLISSGNVDSMVNNYSVHKRRRKTDSYSPGGKAGNRPDRAVIVYSNRAKEAYKDVPIIIGGIEASLRRLAHYDYWDDRVRRSILMDSRADLLIYGMGERAIVEVAEALESGLAIKDITWIRGTAYRAKLEEDFFKGINLQVLPTYQELVDSKHKYAESFKIQYRNNDHIIGKTLIEPYKDYSVVVNPPPKPLNTMELDDVYELPYEKSYHPIYDKLGGVPAIEEVKFSIAANRGCFGGCAFCAITYHQGRSVQGRSKESIVNEAESLTKRDDFKGYIHDVGGPTANFRSVSCKKQLRSGICVDRDCLFPEPCKNLELDHGEYIDVLRAVRNLPGIKKVFIRSGIRYDYVMKDEKSNFLEEICKHHISGILKVAPEHVSARVLKRMRKPPIEVFEKFADRYKRINERIGKKQYLIPYLISSHPGSTLEDAIELALYLKKNRFVPDQVQDFYPTPGTLSTCMYYTGLDPLNGEEVYVAKDIKEKSLQRALLQFNKPENRKLVMEALTLAGRKDLINVLR
jgi:uncharacterized radical SAM protein YgiQ